MTQRPGQDGDGRPEDGIDKPGEPPANPEQAVDEADEESFPASDPPESYRID